MVGMGVPISPGAIDSGPDKEAEELPPAHEHVAPRAACEPDEVPGVEGPRDHHGVAHHGEAAGDEGEPLMQPSGPGR